MSYQLLGQVLSLVASVDLSAYIHCAVAVDANGKAALPTAGGFIVGVLTDKQVAGQAVSVQHGGVAQWKLGGTVDEGDRVVVDASGQAVTATAQQRADGKVVGICLVGGGSGALGSILLCNYGTGTVSTTASESPSGVSGNYDLTPATSESLLTLGTANRTGALADGLFVGQRKRILVIAASGGFTYALTPATMLAGQPTSFTFTAVGQMVELTWTATGWRVTDVKTAGAGTTAAAGTINPLIRRQGLTIGSAGAEDRILPSGWVAGHQIKIAADTVGSGTTTISGLFYDEDGSADGIDANYNAALDEATYTWDGARWLVDSIISVNITT